jgi:hypothetical protein
MDPIPTDDRLISWHLAELEAAYWYDVDHNWGRRARESYVENAVFDLGVANDTRYVGIEQIERFYRWREGRGDRTARHLIANLTAEIVAGGTAHVRYIMSLFAEDGPPVRPSKPPILIADVSVAWTLCSDGRWRAVERKLAPVFMGGAKPTAMKIEQAEQRGGSSS